MLSCVLKSAGSQAINSSTGDAQRARRTGDILFVVQLLCALAFGLAQAKLMLTTTEGVSITWLSFWGVFLFINLSLSWRAHLVQPSRITLQTLAVYAVWAGLMLLNSIIFIVRDSGVWTSIDTLTAVWAIAGIVVTLLVGAHKRLGITDPIVRGYLAVFFKAVPQLTLGWNMLQVGAAGVSVVGIIAGHITICTRLGQIFLSMREAGWDRNRRGSAISEIANELSWVVATICWLVVQ